jgi:O-antigen/teichoic acid export membrane protein
VRDRVRHLSAGVAIYGAGDAAITVVNILLLPVYTRILTPADYGAVLILTSIETFAKIVNRWGLDGAFMRFYLDRGDGGPRQSLATSILAFLLVVDGVLLGAALVGSRWLAVTLFDGPAYLTALRLMFVNTFLIGFTFVPFVAMRVRREARAYSGFTFARSVGMTGLRLVFVMGARWGVAGMYLADLVVTLMILPLLWPWFKPLIGSVFSMRDLRASLRFGLPRLPHGLAQQAFDSGNKLLFNTFAPLGALGVYQNASTLGTGVKFFLASFETAWAPFYYATAREPDAKDVLRKMTTYGIAVIVLLVAGTAAVADDLVRVMLPPEYLEATPVVWLISVGLGFQGLYLLTSIGLNITNHTKYYPITTFAAAAVGLSAGFVLMPRFGAVGAAVAFVLSLVTQAAVAFTFSQRVYPLPYELGRIARVVLSGAVAALVALWAIPAWPPMLGLLARGTAAVVVYGTLLWGTGFLRPSERAFLVEVRQRIRTRKRGAATGVDDQ